MTRKEGRKEQGRKRPRKKKGSGMNVSNPERKGSKTVPLASDPKNDVKGDRKLFLVPENCNIQVTPVAG